MKKILLQWLSLLALSATTLLLNTAHAGYQDEHSGCRLVLCLANPNGPTSVAECRPDINEMYNQLTKEDPFIPSCDEAKAKGTFFTMRQDHYAICPAGTMDSRRSGYTDKYIRQGNGQYAFNNPTSGVYYGHKDEERPTALACTSTEKPRVTTICANNSWGHDCNQIHIYSFNKVVWLPFNPNPQVADVYIENKLFHRARLYENGGNVDAIIE